MCLFWCCDSHTGPDHYSVHDFKASEKRVECGELLVASSHDEDGIEAHFSEDLRTSYGFTCRVHAHVIMRPACVTLRSQWRAAPAGLQRLSVVQAQWLSHSPPARKCLITPYVHSLYAFCLEIRLLLPKSCRELMSESYTTICLMLSTSTFSGTTNTPLLS